MPTPFGRMRMSTKSELSYGALFLVVSLVARSVALAAPVGLLRDAVGVFSVVMLVGGVIVVIVGLWHAARRTGQAPAASGTGDTARRETSPSPVTSEQRP